MTRLILVCLVVGLGGCVSRQKYLDYGRDCRDNGEKVGIAKAQAEIETLRNSRNYYEEQLQQCRDKSLAESIRYFNELGILGEDCEKIEKLRRELTNEKRK